MKKLLLVGVALAAGATIAFAISASTGSDSISNSVTAQDSGDARDDRSRGFDDCLSDFWVVYALETEDPGWCDCGFGVKHAENSMNCCNHDPGTIRLSFDTGATWHEMDLHHTEAFDPCDKMVYMVSGIQLKRGVIYNYTVDCDAHASCLISGWVEPVCGE